jgi:hypothetical protein
MLHTDGNLATALRAQTGPAGGDRGVDFGGRSGNRRGTGANDSKSQKEGRRYEKVFHSGYGVRAGEAGESRQFLGNQREVSTLKRLQRMMKKVTCDESERGRPQAVEEKNGFWLQQKGKECFC